MRMLLFKVCSTASAPANLFVCFLRSLFLWSGRPLISFSPWPWSWGLVAWWIEQGPWYMTAFNITKVDKGRPRDREKQEVKVWKQQGGRSLWIFQVELRDRGDWGICQPFVCKGWVGWALSTSRMIYTRLLQLNWPLLMITNKRCVSVTACGGRGYSSSYSVTTKKEIVPTYFWVHAVEICLKRLHFCTLLRVHMFHWNQINLPQKDSWETRGSCLKGQSGTDVLLTFSLSVV